MRRPRVLNRRLAVLALLIGLCACSPHIVDPGPMTGTPYMQSGKVVTRDGLALPYRVWPAAAPPTAVLVAVHGFNDYSNFFDAAANYLAARGIQTYAYDQRGFGAAPFAGQWFATERYLTDVRDVADAVKRLHPALPLYLLGESMGGAVVMSMLVRDNPETVAGAILSAPAVWGRDTMPWYQKMVLWLAAHTVPDMHLTGRGLDIKPSDNIEMLRAMGRDPLVIKGADVTAINGLVDLMDVALDAARGFDDRALILYGAKDEIVQAGPTREMFVRLPNAADERRRVAVYDNGYHMLLRDLQAETVWADIAHWIERPGAPLPSGAEATARTFLTLR